MQAINETNGPRAHLGIRYGDESKGGMTDALAHEGDTIVRDNGGDNASHTVTIGEETVRLNLVPSGILRPGTICVIGNGVVLNPNSFLNERGKLSERGVDVDPSRLLIDRRASLIMPYHILEDALHEAATGGKVGTTLRGIGYAYADRTARTGPRVNDLLRPDFEQYFMEKLNDKVPFLQVMANHPNIQPQIDQLDRELMIKPDKHKQRLLDLLKNAKTSNPIDPLKYMEDLDRARKEIAPHIQNTVELVSEKVTDRKGLIFEGAQGMMLDIDLGPVPFVTSSHPGMAGIVSAYGVYPHQLDYVLGVAKAFDSKVGGGPMVTEVFDDEAMMLRGTGKNPWDEYGGSTGRPRRVGWFDAVSASAAARLNAVTALGLAKMDIIARLPTIKLCVAYEYRGKRIDKIYDLDAEVLAGAEPIYEEFEGNWALPSGGVQSWEDVPRPAQRYISRIEELMGGIPVRITSWGPARDAKVYR